MTDTALALARTILLVMEADPGVSCACREVTTPRGRRGVKVLLGWYGRTLGVIADGVFLWMRRDDPHGFHESVASWEGRCNALREAASWLTCGGGPPSWPCA